MEGVLRRSLSFRRAGHTYEVEIVAQHAAELPPGITYAGFQWKRKGRLSVADAVEVQDGCAEWNVLCRQTTTLQKDPAAAAGGHGWRAKEFVFKVRQFQHAGDYTHGKTVAKASLDLSPYCMPEPFGPRQMTIPLRPQGLLTISIRTQWLRNYDRDADTLTDVSYLSAAPTAATTSLSWMAEDQDLSGFDALGLKEPQPAAAATAPVAAAAAGFGGFGGGRGRRPPGATMLQVGEASSHPPGAEASVAPTPTLIMGGGGGRRGWQAGAAGGGVSTPVARGLPQEQWSPVDLDKVREKLASSDEEDGGSPGKRQLRPVRALKRWFAGGTDSERTSPDVELARIERETCVVELQKRCSQLLAERDEARAEGYAAQSEALQRAVELDNLARTKVMMAERLRSTEEQLMAMCKDEAGAGLVAALAGAKVELAEKDFTILELQGEVRKCRAQVESLRAKLTSLETRYRTSLHSGSLSPSPASPKKLSPAKSPLKPSPGFGGGSARAASAAAAAVGSFGGEGPAGGRGFAGVAGAGVALGGFGSVEEEYVDGYGYGYEYVPGGAGGGGSFKIPACYPSAAGLVGGSGGSSGGGTWALGARSSGGEDGGQGQLLDGAVPAVRGWQGGSSETVEVLPLAAEPSEGVR